MTQEERLLKAGVLAEESLNANNMRHWRLAVEDYFRKKSLIGKAVVIRFGTNEAEVHTGLLLGFGTNGEYVLENPDNGSLFFGWTLLDIQEK